MDKNKTIITSISIVCITIVFLGYLTYLDRKFKDKVILNYSEYTFCIRSVMEKSKDNGKPCSAQDAEKICSKFNK